MTNKSALSAINKIRLYRYIAIAVVYGFLCWIVLVHEFTNQKKQVQIEREFFVRELQNIETNALRVLDTFAAYSAQSPSPTTAELDFFALQLMQGHPYIYSVAQIKAMSKAEVEAKLSPSFQLTQLRENHAQPKLTLIQPFARNYVTHWIYPNEPPHNQVMGLEISNIWNLHAMVQSSQKSYSMASKELHMFDKNYMDSFPLLEGGYAFSVNKVAEYDAQFNDPGLILSMLFNEAELVAYLQSMVSYAELRVGIQYGDAYRWYGDSPSGAWYEFTKVDAFRYPFINTDMHFELHKTVGISQMNIKFIMLLTLFLVIALTVFELMHRRVLANYQFLLSQNTKLKENIKNRSDLFGFIAHELNTPLTLISSPTQQMLTHTNYDQQTYQHLKTILRNTEKMQQVIDRILELKRYQTRSLQPETLNIVEHLVQLYTPYKSMFLAKELLFIESGNIYDIIPLTVDKSSFNIVLDNLLSNALKYTPVHGTVEVNWHRDMQYCYISLSNSFPPLTAQQRNDIFTKYVRNTSSDTQGYGLGLGLVSEICERNQWFIQCNSNVSEEGKSELEFVLVLPVASTEPA